MTSTRRVVITGMGVVSSIGHGREAFWKALAEGRNGVGPISRFDTSRLDVRFAGELRDFDAGQLLDKKLARRLDPFAQYAVVAADQALADSGLEPAKENPERIGAILGTGIGGMTEFSEQQQILDQRGPDRVSPFFIPKLMGNAAPGHIAIRLGLKGPNFAVSSACASANHAIGLAFDCVRRGLADAMFTGGSEAAIIPLGMAGFCSLKALSTRNDDPARASRPFDRDRDGFVMGEGGGVLVLEELEYARRRGARIFAEVLGWGMTDDAHHITAPDPAGWGASRAMGLALEDGGVDPTEVDYINAHGTSTPLNDSMECQAIRAALGEDHARRVMISSTKSMIGHLLGGSGGPELIAACLAVSEGIVPPTINHEHNDPECGLDCVPNTAREARVRVALSNSLGFGGHNATICIGRLRDL